MSELCENTPTTANGQVTLSRKVLNFDILTIFPEFFGAVFDVGIIRRARLANIVSIEAHDIRKFAPGKHKIVDDRPFGGGDGMVFKPEPIFNAVENLLGTVERENYPSQTRVVLLSPQGKVLDQAAARNFAENAQRIVIICGRYEGVDERVNERLVTDEISIGDYVLSGGEPAAVVLIDAVTRLLPNALGSETSAQNDSFAGLDGILDCPHYTRPAEFRGMRVPDVLLEGNHAAIEKWRRQKALEKTAKTRKDLLPKL